tara:strand:- start:251 stop:697 length:447 start_codon:yes stop_codon:yes gene_type:complete
MKANKKTIQYIILFIILCIVIYLISIWPALLPIENMKNMGLYPSSVDNPILKNDYLVKNNTQVSDNEYSDIYLDYPIFPAKSSKINNIKYWRRPNNGTCSRAEFCGGIYENTKQEIPLPPNPPPWNNKTRVNFYDINLGEHSSTFRDY